MIRQGSVHAIIPSRGNLDLSGLVGHLRAYPEIGLVSIECGLHTFNRYLAARRSTFQTIYTQDDDCITDLAPLFEKWGVGFEGTFVNAMTPEHAAQYPGRETLVGFGTLFAWSMLCKSPMMNVYEWDRDDLFLRESDRVFASIHDHLTVFPRIEILPAASESYRLWKQPDHIAARNAIRERIRSKMAVSEG